MGGRGGIGDPGGDIPLGGGRGICGPGGNVLPWEVREAPTALASNAISMHLSQALKPFFTRASHLWKPALKKANNICAYVGTSRRQQRESIQV